MIVLAIAHAIVTVLLYIVLLYRAFTVRDDLIALLYLAGSLAVVCVMPRLWDWMWGDLL